MTFTIAIIDMHIRDERLLEFLAQKNGVTTTPEICKAMQCHPNTARSMLRRLQLAGKLRITHRAHRFGLYYEVIYAG